MDQSTANLIARINTVKVTADDLLLASDEIHKLPPEDRTWDGRAHCAARLFKGQHEKAFAVTSRLEAMVKMIDSGRLPHWVAPEAEDGGRMISEPVFIAAATEPLLFTKKEAFFHSGSFVECVLRNTEADGHA